MRRTFLLLLCAVALGQDEGGRDKGEGPDAVLFLSWNRTDETGAIWQTAWRALEPHGSIHRSRLVSFDGDEARAHAYLLRNSKAAIVVAFDPSSAALAEKLDPERPVLLVSHTPDAAVVTRTDRALLVRLMQTLRPGVERVAVLGNNRETLPGLESVACETPEDAAGCGIAWLPEGTSIDLPAWRAKLDRMGIPLVVTAGAPPLGHATLTLRPHPEGVGLKLAAAVLAQVRKGEAPRGVVVRRHRMVVDLDAAARAGLSVPLSILAQADIIRRSS